jgi:hypothetical protein
LGQIAIGINANQLRIGTFGHKLCNTLRVAIAGMKNYDYFCHKKSPNAALKKRPALRQPQVK